MKRLNSWISFFLAIALLLPFGVVHAETATSFNPYAGYFVYAKGTPKNIWYVNPITRNKYLVKTSIQAWRVVKTLGYEEALASHNLLKGLFVLKKSGPIHALYINPENGKKISLKNGSTALKTFRKLAKELPAAELADIPEGSFKNFSKKLTTFSSVKEFDAYTSRVQKTRDAKNKTGDANAAEGDEEVSMVDVTTPPPTGTPAQAESITNTQEQGVDEGDIVKAYGNYFIVLRRGRLFTIKIADGGNASLSPISKIDAYPEGLTGSSWYDEMLIYQNRIIVIGYSYNRQATEVGLFKISEAGELSHEATYFLDSDDYYSSRNYASRLISGKLVFYMPIYLFREAYDEETQTYKTEAHLPSMKKWVKGNETTASENILAKTDIYKALQEIDDPTLHTVVTCDLLSEFNCTAKSVLGPSPRNFYVSSDAIYLWISTWNVPDSYVYRMSLTDDSTKVLRADGSPVDQFSFNEKDGYLNVFVTDDGHGDAMWSPEIKGVANPALLRVSLNSFSATPDLVSRNFYTSLPRPASGDSYMTIQNRFVGDYLLYAQEASWYSSDEGGVSYAIYAKKFATKDPTQSVPLTHSIDRIEVMGDAAVAIGPSQNDLKFSAISLGENAAVENTYTQVNSSQGELRSHGFFYKPQSDGTGILGLPIRTEGSKWDSYIDDSAGVLFLKVGLDKAFSSLGSLDSSPANSELDDSCAVSCVDWYGNARPIFYAGRIFALMGYELIEGTIADGALKEIARTDYFIRQ